jgi:hypothetical protein
MTRLTAAIAITIAIIVLTTVPACGGESHMETSIQAVKKAHETELMAVPGVVSVGIGRDEHGTAVIIVGLDRERPAAVQQLPRRLEGYEVRAEVVGKIRASGRDQDEHER